MKQLMGSASKSDRSKKAHEEKLKRQKKARAQAGEIASYIGYDAIYKDGIAVAAELKGAFDDIKSALDFTSFLKK